MNAIWQVLLALLAVVGLLALGWLLFGKLVTPVGGGGGGPVYAVVPAAGDGDAGFHAPGKIARSRFATLTLERLESPCSQRDVPISTRRSSP